VELGLFTELAKGPAYLGDLSRRLGLPDRSARDFLDALVALKMLDRQDGRYSVCPNASRRAASSARASSRNYLYEITTCSIDGGKG
jgi:DNA-binding IclR family transcriptional regulator